MKKEELKKLIENNDLTLDQVINAVIEINGIVGVGLVTLADSVSEYILSKIN